MAGQRVGDAARHRRACCQVDDRGRVPRRRVRAPPCRGSIRRAASTASGSTSSRLSVEPVERSSRTTTCSTPAVVTRRRQRFEPMNPAPPVTSTAHGRRRYRRRSWRRGCSGSPRASVRAARSASSSKWRGRSIGIVSSCALAYVLPWKDHLAGELEEAGVETVCLSTRRRDPRWPLRLRELIATGGFDVVHSHSPVPAVAARLAASSLPRRSRPMLVTTEHNTWTSYRRATRWANRLTSGADAATFAVTEEVRASLRGAAADASRGARPRHRRRRNRGPDRRRARGDPGRSSG